MTVMMFALKKLMYVLYELANGNTREHKCSSKALQVGEPSKLVHIFT